MTIERIIGGLSFSYLLGFGILWILLAAAFVENGWRWERKRDVLVGLFAFIVALGVLLGIALMFANELGKLVIG